VAGVAGWSAARTPARPAPAWPESATFCGVDDGSPDSAFDSVSPAWAANAADERCAAAGAVPRIASAVPAGGCVPAEAGGAAGSVIGLAGAASACIAGAVPPDGWIAAEAGGAGCMIATGGGV
jgi:hypothetical protein